MSTRALTLSRRTRGGPRWPATATVCAAAWLLLPWAGPAQAQSYPSYAVTPLPVTAVSGFNDAGLILGQGFVPCSGLCTQSSVPVLYNTKTGATTALGGGFGGNGAQFHALNAQGQLAGSSTTIDGTGATVRSVIIRQPDGSVTTLATPVLSATQTSGLKARGLNASGQIVLAHSDGLDQWVPVCGNYQAWIGTGATPASWRAVGTSAAVLRLAGINASGLSVGAAAPAATCSSAASFRAVAAQPSGALVDLHGSLPGSFSRANAVNDLGYAVGQYDSGARTQPDAYNPQGVAIERAAVWNTAAQAWFDLGAAGQSRLNAVNNRGEVVGSANPTLLAGQAYLPSATRAVLGNLATPWPMVDLNTLLANNTAGWVLQEAVAINGSGQIVARGVAANVSGFVLLTPVSPPANPYAVLPSAPASLAASQVTATSAVLTWTNTARNATRLQVERCRGSGCTNFLAIATLASDTARFTNTGLSARTTYRWRVRAGNATGLSAPSNLVQATTLR